MGDLRSDLGPADYHDPDGTGWRQRDLTVTQAYDRRYLDERYGAIDDRVRALAARRVALVSAVVPDRGALLDFGCGTGRVVEAARAAGWDAWGYDVAPWPGGWRVASWRYVTGHRWRVASLFDVLEHLPAPAAVVRELAAEWVVVSCPWCHHPRDWSWFGKWRHRRPGEHLVHHNPRTLDRFFAGLGYRNVLLGSPEDPWRPNPDQAEANILTSIFKRSAG